MSTRTPKLRTVTLDEAIDKHIGKRGTPGRERFERKVQRDRQSPSTRKSPMRIYTLAESKDHALGPIGTPVRDAYETEIRLARLGDMVREARIERNLTQEELGRMAGVEKGRISRLEKNAANVPPATILRVFDALKAKVTFSVELSGKRIKVA